MKRILLVLSLSIVVFCAFRIDLTVDKLSILDQSDGVRNLKQSLREIASLTTDTVDSRDGGATKGVLTTQDLSDLGSVMDVADHSILSPHRGNARKFHQASDQGCDKECLDALSMRMLASSPHKALSESDHSVQQLDSMNDDDNTVGAERVRREERSANEIEERAKFVKAEKRRMEEAVTRGWKDLKNGLHAQAKSELKSAKYFHRAMIHLLQGSSDLNRNLPTPKRIAALQNALYTSLPKQQPVPEKLKDIIDSVPAAKQVDSTVKSENDDQTPEKLEAIMHEHFVDRNRYHALPDKDGTKKNQASIHSESVLHSETVKEFEELLSKELKKMRNALDHGRVGPARAAVKQASFYLQTIRDASDPAQEGGVKLRSLRSRYDGLHRTLRRYEARRSRVRAAKRNLSRRSDNTQSVDRFAYPQRLSADSLNTRELFEDAIRTGVRDLKKGEIGKAQGKLVEARYYANSQGYLKVKPTYTSLQRRNARTAQLALKLLAKDILRKERKNGKQSEYDTQLSGDDHAKRRKPSLKSVIQSLSRDVARGRRHNIRHARTVRNGDHDADRDESRSFEDNSKSNLHEDGRARKSWQDLFNPGHRSDLFAAANGQQEENRLRDHEAKRKEKADCNSLLCLLPNKPEVSSVRRGPSLQSMAGLGGLKSSDFAKTKTDFHTGLDLSKRLKRGGVVPKELRHTNPDSGSGAGSLSSVSMRDAEADVLRQEAKDAKKSMAEALVAYKSLLHQEVALSRRY